jgi:hypothetical protein
MLWLILFFGILVALLIYWEYKDHDCLPHKNCNNKVPKPKLCDDPLTTIDKIKGMVKNNYDYESWRLALLTGIIATIAIVYYLEDRIPTFTEWIIVGGLIFIATYLSTSWIWAHFFQPNGIQTEKSLTQLRDKVHTLIHSYDNNRKINNSMYLSGYSSNYSGYSGHSSHPSYSY